MKTVEICHFESKEHGTTTPFSISLNLSKIYKTGYPVHPNELHLFRRVYSPWCCWHPAIV